MKSILKAEEFALFILGIVLFSFLHMSWWWFPVLLLLPDVGMLGYLFDSKVGAFFYNLFHHRAVAVILLLIGYFNDVHGMLLAGVIMFSHIAFDRMLGYGLKYPSSFKNTHLGEIGK
ncbi:hypothetical protein ULMS_00230 [Patiriisocius marinistellae]|uniref:DUF4260 domain-containing protein n=1 Tax=Patiriisocius marinistellae TaxID=2494560 RepID=A0A5J4FWU2_9FLAO|nr:DUF4260 domain-containing protein [Patiriisocius marinistellae]GEQ84515.1 hypothetical protein ULMS_00230 [Patiriisocius marinistellae]